jgi:hypothetical protein
MHQQRPSTGSCYTLVAISSIGFALLATTSAAEPAAWNQAKVMEIAEKLKQVSRQLYDAEYKAPAAFGGTGGENRSELMDTIRRLEHETAHLAGSLENGASRKSTLGSYKQIGELKRDADESARMIPLLEPVQKIFSQMEDLISQLAPSYNG